MYSVFFLVVIMVLLCEIRVHGQTPQSNQGSQGRQRAKPGFRQQITIENRGQRERTQRKRGPETRKHATRVPRSRKEANKGSRGSQRGKQGFPGVEKRQTRVHSGLKEANKGSQGPGPRKPGFSARKNRKTGFPVQQSTETFCNGSVRVRVRVSYVRVRVRLIWDKKIRFFFPPSYCYVWGKYPV